jgi:cytosolic carboxypeptidase protein 2/3
LIEDKIKTDVDPVQIHSTKHQANEVGGPYSVKYMATHEGEADGGVSDPADMFIPVKTGTTVKHMKNPPYHIKESFDFEPMYQP